MTNTANISEEIDVTTSPQVSLPKTIDEISAVRMLDHALGFEPGTYVGTIDWNFPFHGWFIFVTF